MTIAELIKSKSAKEKKQATAILSSIRELEEESKGNFVAFVDENTDSWDVQISIDPKTLACTKYSCDCPSKSKICKHLLSVLIALSKGKKIQSDTKVTKRIRKKKLTVGELLVENIESHQLIDWLVNQLNGDKELQQKFKADFKEKDEAVKVKDIVEFYTDSRKAVLGRRRKLMVPDLTKILKVCAPYFDRIIDRIQFYLDQKENFDVLKVIVNCLIELENECHKSTTRIKTYVSKISTKLNATLPDLTSEKKQSIFRLVINDGVLNNDTAIFYLNIIDGLLQGLDQKMKEELMTLGIKKNLFEGYYSEKTFIAILEVFEKQNLLSSLKNMLQPIYSYNNYNLRLLEAYAGIGENAEVVKISHLMISQNRGFFAIPYYRFLINFHEKNKDYKSAKKLRFDSISVHLDYEIISGLLKMELDNNELDTLLIKLGKIRLVKSDNNYLNNLTIKFEFWDYCNEYYKMVDHIRSIDAVLVAKKYEEAIVEKLKSAYIQKICHSLEYVWYDKQLEEVYDSFRSTLNAHYTWEEMIPIYNKLRSERLRIEILEVYQE